MGPEISGFGGLGFNGSGEGYHSAPKPDIGA